MRYQAGIQIGLIIVAIIIIVTVIKPKFTVISEKQDEMAILKDKIEKVDRHLQALEEKINRANQISREDMQELNTYVPNRIDSLAVARDLSNMVKDNGLLLQDVSVGESSMVTVAANSAQANEGPMSLAAQAKRDLTTQEFKVEMIGTYERMKEVIKAIEENAYPLRITALEFANTVSDTNALLFTYKITVHAYALNQTNI